MKEISMSETKHTNKDQAHAHWAKPWYEIWPQGRRPGAELEARWAEQARRARELRAKDPRPNILFLFTDQQTSRAMSCAGNPWVNTPNMDALAEHGIRFTRSYCTFPACSPARSSLLTSRMPHETGVIFNGMPIHPSIPTMGEIFRDAGYLTVWSGKWHLPRSYERAPDGIPGFDNIPAPFGQMRNLHGLGDQVDFLFATDAEVLLRWELARVGLPWLYCVSLHNPHDICHWTELPKRHHRNLDRYPPLPGNFAIRPDEPEILQMVRQTGSGNQEIPRTVDWDEAQWRAYIAAYYHMTEQVDRAVGLILNALYDGGWADNTLVIFTSDHGDGCAAHHWVAKNTFHEEPMTVPLILSFPGRIPEGAVEDRRLASGLDVLPTMCDYAGVRPPGIIRGRSLRPLIEDPQTPWRDFVAAEFSHGKPDAPRFGRMICGERYKYNLYSIGQRREELFDLRADPGEMSNRAGGPPWMATLECHRAWLEQWARETGDAIASSMLQDAAAQRKGVETAPLTVP